MHQSVKRIIAFSAILFINFNAMFYFYRKDQIATVGSPHEATSQTVANHVIRALNEAPKDAISGGVGLNATSAVEGKPVSKPNAETQKTMGFMGSEEYRTLLETLPSDSRTMQTFLGLVLDESNKSRSGMDAFRSILSMADTSEARNKYSQYKIKQPEPQQDAVTSKKPGGAQNPLGMKKQQQPAQANTPNKVRNRDSKVKVKLDDNGRIQVQEPPKYEVEKLIFEPMRTKYSASLFNMYHAFQPEYFTELTPTIPHIIHQTWDSYDIPGVFKPWIKSIVNKHPDWEYWFWTPKDVECLLRKRYPPKYLETYRKYNAMIFKSDFLR